MRGEVFVSEIGFGKEMPPRKEDNRLNRLKQELEAAKLTYVEALKKNDSKKMEKIGKGLDEKSALELRAQVEPPVIPLILGNEELLELYNQVLEAKTAVDEEKNQE